MDLTTCIMRKIFLKRVDEFGGCSVRSRPELVSGEWQYVGILAAIAAAVKPGKKSSWLEIPTNRRITRWF